MFFFTKSELHLYFNSIHHPFTDYFFRFVTHIADGLFVGAIILFLVFIRYRYALFLGLSFLFSSLIAQFFKKIVFPDFDRPKKFFESIAELHYVPGVELHSFNSFPSGHATSSFVLFCCLAFIVNSKYLKFTFFIIALTVALSRVYLSQHFFMDIYFGSIIGVVSTFAAYYIIQNTRKLNENIWLDKSLMDS